MIRNRSVRVKILLGIFIVILLFATAAVLNFNELKSVNDALKDNSTREKDQRLAYEIKNYVGILYSNQADVIINQSNEAVEDYNKHKLVLLQFIEQVSNVLDTPNEIAVVKELNEASLGFIDSFDKVYKVFMEKSTFTTDELSRQYKVLDDETDAFKARIYASADQLIQSFSKEYEASNAYSINHLNQVSKHPSLATIISSPLSTKGLSPTTLKT